MTAILTDSTCDLSPQELRRLGVGAVSLDIELNGQFYSDWTEIDTKTVFRELQQGQQVKSSPPTTETFVHTYRPLLEQHQDIISVHISAKLSDTLRNAREAAEYLKATDRIHIVDSGFSSMALAEQVLRAAELAELAQTDDELDIEDILESLGRLRHYTVGEFCAGSLEHLRRAGRLSRTQEMMGGVLGLRTILAFQDGRIVPVRNVQEKKAMGNIIASLEKQFGRTPLSVTAINAGQDTDRIAELKGALQESSLNIQRGRLQLFGAAVGADLGPGSFGFMAVPIDVLN
jgi:DegV family protein with EDD domain